MATVHSGRELLPLGWTDAEVKGWADLRPVAPPQRPQNSRTCACGEPLLPGSQYGRACLAEDRAEDLYRVQIADPRAW